MYSDYYQNRLRHFEELSIRIYFRTCPHRSWYTYQDCMLWLWNGVEHHQRCRRKFVIFIWRYTYGTNRITRLRIFFFRLTELCLLESLGSLFRLFSAFFCDRFHKIASNCRHLPRSFVTKHEELKIYLRFQFNDKIKSSSPYSRRFLFYFFQPRVLDNRPILSSKKVPNIFSLLLSTWS